MKKGVKTFRRKGKKEKVKGLFGKIIGAQPSQVGPILPEKGMGAKKDPKLSNNTETCSTGQEKRN